MTTPTQLPTPTTRNWGLVGHEWAVDHLEKTLRHGRTRHAYLFTGPANIGKTTLARALAQRLNCLQEDEALRPCGECLACRKIASGNHPDLTIVEADRTGGTLKIDQLREMMRMLALQPYEGRYRVGIIRRFHEARPQAADALLKTLEEPPPYVVLLLTAENLNLLPKTITSRCQPLRLRPVPVQQVEDALNARWHANSERAALLAQLSGGRLGWAVRMLQNEDALGERALLLDDLELILGENRAARFQRAAVLAKDKAKLRETLILWQSFWRDVLLVNTLSGLKATNRDRQTLLNRLGGELDIDAVHTALKATRQAIADLERNVNTRLAVEVMLLDYPGLKRGGV